MLNLLLLTTAGIIAYLLAYIANYLEKKRFQRDLRKFFKSDLDKYKAVKIVEAAQHISIESGIDEETAFYNACTFLDEIARKGLLDEKYRMLKEA